MDDDKIKPLQRLASDPNFSIWVEASAGSGKTTILINRLLRLALHGVIPQTIITLTYTKIAATEIRKRLYNEIIKWMNYSDELLNENYLLLTGKTAKESINKLRLNLFDFEKNIYDVSILTFHAYCISLLYKFPLEANLAPDFSLNSEEQTRSVLFEAETNVLSYAMDSSNDKTFQSKNKKLASAYEIISIKGLYSSLNKFLRDVSKKRFMLKSNSLNTNLCLDELLNNVLKWDVFSYNVTTDDCEQLLNKYTLKLGPWINKKIINKNNSKNTDVLAQELLEYYNIQENLITIKYFLENLFLMDIYLCLWTSKINTQVKVVSFHYSKNNKLGIKDLQRLPNYIDRQINDVLEQLVNTRRRKPLQYFFNIELNYFALCSAYFTVCEAFLQEYSDLKSNRDQIDYEDIINVTCELLEDKNNLVPWVIYKLDYEINHILIDEAQDTSPKQWQIILALVKQILLESENNSQPFQRSLFVVGDYKQSIYSFQGANPDSFIDSFNKLRAMFKLHKQELRKVELGINYRSSQLLLNFVDNLFNNENKIGESMGVNKWLNHRSANPSLTGKITVIKIVKPKAEKKPKQPIESGSIFDETVKTSLQIAISKHNIPETPSRNIEKQCNYLIDYIEDNKLPCGDILTLLPRRSHIQSPLSKALYKRNIKQSANDTINIDNDGAVLDLIMAYTCGMNVYDDYTLSCLLRSPFIELSEEDLFLFSNNRKNSIFNELSNNPKYNVIRLWLNNLTYIVKNNTIYSGLTSILASKPPSPTKNKKQKIPQYAWNGMQSLLYRFGEQSRDSIDILLSIALKHDNQAESAQYFLNLFNANSQTIKRELESKNNHSLRIMTVHAAKGLESPIVILPDLHWPSNQTLGLDVTLWSKEIPIPKLNQEFQPKSIASFIEINKTKKYQETLRILYVALTRSKQELIFLYEEEQGKVKTSLPLWSSSIDNIIKDNDFKLIKKNQDYCVFSYGSNTTETIKKTIKNKIAVPSWVEKYESNQSNIDASPNHVSDTPESDSLNKGMIIHSILLCIDSLYNHSDSINKTKSNTFMKINKLFDYNFKDLDPKLKKEYNNEIINMIYHKDLKAFFPSLYDSDSDSDEVLIINENEWITVKSSSTNNHSILRPDRICIFKDSLWIIDYKTHSNPPTEVSSVSKSIINQMEGYKKTLSNSYPQKTIYNLIVWTQGPIIMNISACL